MVEINPIKTIQVSRSCRITGLPTGENLIKIQSPFLNKTKHLKNYKRGSYKGPLTPEVPQWHYPPVNVDTLLMNKVTKKRKIILF